MTDKSYSIRAFLLEEINIYKAIRLEALQLEGDKFGNSYATEAAFPENEWVDRVTNPDRCCFGLFYMDELIGITAIILDANNLDIAYMTQSYIQKKYRGLGLSKLLYKARIDWARKKQVKVLTISHRERNVQSRAAIIHNGFKPTHTEMRMWGDGTEENNVFYELHL